MEAAEVGSAVVVLVEVAGSVEAAELGPAAGFLEVAEHDLPSGVRRHSAVPVAERRVVQGRRLRVLAQALAVLRGRMSEEETSAARTDLRRSLDRDRTSALVPAIVLRRRRALGQAQELAKELPIVLASRNDRLSCQGLAAERLARDCRIKEPVCKTAQPIDRRLCKIVAVISAIACRRDARTGRIIGKTCKAIAKTRETTIVKTGRTGLTTTSTITATGITAAGTAVGIPERAGATCGTTIRSRPRSV